MLRNYLYKDDTKSTFFQQIRNKNTTSDFKYSFFILKSIFGLKIQVKKGYKNMIQNYQRLENFTKVRQIGVTHSTERGTLPSKKSRLDGFV